MTKESFRIDDALSKIDREIDSHEDKMTSKAPVQKKRSQMRNFLDPRYWIVLIVVAFGFSVMMMYTHQLIREKSLPWDTLVLSMPADLSRFSQLSLNTGLDVDASKILGVQIMVRDKFGNLFPSDYSHWKVVAQDGRYVIHFTATQSGHFSKPQFVDSSIIAQVQYKSP